MKRKEAVVDMGESLRTKHRREEEPETRRQNLGWAIYRTGLSEVEIRHHLDKHQDDLHANTGGVKVRCFPEGMVGGGLLPSTL